MLYGDYDENTKVWTDGVLALTVRNYLGILKHLLTNYNYFCYIIKK
jgi:hypothetical protein